MKTNVADPDTGSGIGAFLTAGSGIRDGKKSDPGSETRDKSSRIRNTNESLSFMRSQVRIGVGGTRMLAEARDLE